MSYYAKVNGVFPNQVSARARFGGLRNRVPGVGAGERACNSRRDARSSAWGAQRRPYNGIVPAHPWSLKSGDWGAFEIAARYSVIDLNDRLGFAG